MAWNVKTDSVTGVMKFQLMDDDGDPVASFRLNPTDINLANRFVAAGEFFGNLAKNAPDSANLEEVQRYNDALEQELAKLIGGDCLESMFGVIPAISIMPSGNLFALELFEKMSEHIAPEINKRRQKMQDAVGKHTAKYVPKIPDEVINKAVAAANGTDQAYALRAAAADALTKFADDQASAMIANA